MFSLGSAVVLHVNEPEMVREIITCTNPDLGKPLFLARNLGPLLGEGIVSSNGNYWTYQRKILAPELYKDKVKVQKTNHPHPLALLFLLNF
jgi:cytochrome P450 family 714 subfamily C